MKVFLITPAELEESTFRSHLVTALETGLVSALLIKRAGLGEEEYRIRVNALRPVAQSLDCAVLLDDSPELVKKLGADGVHMSSNQEKFSETLEALKPEFIVGAGDIDSRHEAMLRGEAGADYILFGSLDHAPDQAASELAHWWAELFETPSLLMDPATPVTEFAPGSGEFIGLGENIWSAPQGPADALKLAIATGAKQ